MRTRSFKRHVGVAGLLALAGCAAPAWPYLTLDAAKETGYDVLFKASPLVSEARVTVTTLAGTAGRNGLINKPGVDARFSHPRGLAFDKGSGNLLVADTANNAIRTVTTGGTVTTYVGTGKRGMYFDTLSNTARTTATLMLPYSVATNGAGTTYVVDTGRHQLQRASGSTITTQTGLWTVVNRRATPLYQNPAAVAVDSKGTIYFLQGHGLFRITGGAISLVAGAYAPGGQLFETFVSLYEILTPRQGLVDGPAATATFALPQGLAVDAQDNLFIADTFNHAIRKVTFTAGVAAVSTIAGERGTVSGVTTGLKGYEDGAATTARFLFPYGVAVDATGNVIVTDRGNHAVRKVAAGTGRVTTLAGGNGLAGQTDGTGTTAGFKQPSGVAIDATGAIYVSDTGNHTIRKIVQGP